MVTLGGRLVWAARTELALSRGDPRLALEIVNQMMAASAYSEKDVAVRLWMLSAEAFLALAEIQADPAERQSSLKSAEKYLITVQAETRALNYRSKMGQIHLSLVKLYRLQNRLAESEAERQNARNFVLELAGTITDQELRRQYIDRALAV